MKKKIAHYALLHGILCGLMLTLISLPVLADETLNSQKVGNTQVAKYPPYPDVWDWHNPSIRGYPFSMYRLQNGDVLIEYTKRLSKRKEKLETYVVTFFGREQFSGKPALHAIEKAREEMKSRGGRDWEARLNYLKYEAISPDGKLNIKSIIPYNLNCYAGPNRYPYKLTDTATGRERIFTLYRLLDKEEKFHINESCGQPETVIKYKVKSEIGSFYFLEDNSFLFQVEDTGDVIRFSSDLKSKSNLVGYRFFMVENDGDAWGGVEKLTGCEYDDTASPQVITNALYEYLKSQRRK